MGGVDENKQLVREYFEQVEAGNIQVIDELFAEEFTTSTDVVRSEIQGVGREPLKAAWREFFEAFPDVHIQRQELIADEDKVTYIQVWEGTHEGEFRGIDPTGNVVTHEMWGRYVIEDGQIVHGDAQVDNFGRFTQLGLELSIEGYRTLIDTAPDPIIIADSETLEIIETNEAAEALLEQPREEIIGQTQASLHPDDQPYEAMFTDAVSRASDSSVELSEFPDGTAVELVRTDDSRVPVEINAQLVTLAEVTTLASIYRDVSGRRRRKQRLQVLNRVLRHNLRNDLGVIGGLADVLATDLDGDHAARAEKIRTLCLELVELGEKARAVEQIRSAETSAATAVSVSALVGEVATNYPNACLGTDVPPDLSVNTVRSALVLALDNLVENAVRHAESPIELRAAETAGGAEIVVEDAGPGIPDHELAVIEEGGETPLEHGSGVGLWLVHWAVDALRGEVQFEVTGAGTRARVVVPSLDAG